MNTLDDTAALREAMVRELCGPDAIRSDVVASAFTTVPRHLFAPDTPLELAYHPNEAVWAKRDVDGVLVSTVSAAHIQAVMLEQAELGPGMRVLEIGSGGYNAALISEIVRPEGEVTTVDIDPEIIQRARTCLDAAGYPQVRTIVADADSGVPAHAPYDRIVVTVRAWDIPPAWVEQLVPGGRIVVPLRMRGLTRSVALDRVGSDGDVLLRGGDARLCSFVPMQGAGAHDDRLISTDGSIGLRVDVADYGGSSAPRELDDVREAISSGVRGKRSTVWTGVEFDHVPDLDLWLGMWLPRFGILTAAQRWVDDGVLTRAVRRGAPALVSPGGFAYRTTRRILGPDGCETGKHEIGVLAWGPDAAALAEAYTEIVRRWGRYRHAGGTGPTVEVHTSRTAVGPPARADVDVRVLVRDRCTVVLAWPRP